MGCASPGTQGGATGGSLTVAAEAAEGLWPESSAACPFPRVFIQEAAAVLSLVREISSPAFGDHSGSCNFSQLPNTLKLIYRSNTFLQKEGRLFMDWFKARGLQPLNSMLLISTTKQHKPREHVSALHV